MSLPWTGMLLLSFLQPLETLRKEGAVPFIEENYAPSRMDAKAGEGHLKRHMNSKGILMELLEELGRMRDSGPACNHEEQQFSEEQLRWRRTRRGTKDDDAKSVQQYVPGVKAEFPQPANPATLQPTKPPVPSSTVPFEPHQQSPAVYGDREAQVNRTVALGKRLQIQNPLYPVTESSYSAYAVMFLSLIVFAVGIVGNLSVMCIVWHNYYMKSAWNSILASLAFWDFLILFFCLPVVIFNEITKKRLLGNFSCRLVPFMEVRVSSAKF